MEEITMSGKALVNTRRIFKTFGLLLVIVASYLAGTLTSPALTQSRPPQYLVVDYMKVEPGKEQEYLDLEKLWKTVHQELIKAGKRKSWSLYGVGFTGTGNEYNYVTFNVYDKYGDLENPYPAEFLAKAYPNMGLSEVISRVTTVRKLVRSELWTLIDQTQ